ncbi:MAG: M23 family metallopeptidase [Myxococcota bacterium]
MLHVLLLACAGPDGPDTAVDAVRAVTRAPSVPALPALPSPIDPALRVESGFGPRRMPLEDGREDFHLGLDYDAPEGTPVFAVADGVVARVDAGGESDGNVLYVEHPLDPPVTWHGATLDRFYAVYGHLSAFSVSEGDPVATGQLVASVGDTGAAREPHLHFEIRLGTRCTLRYTTENPESTCGLGFDPAVNPYHAVPGSHAGGLDATVLAEDPYTLRLRTADTDLDWNRVATDLGVLDFDLRDGLDATTYDALNDLDRGWIHVVPDLPGDEEGFQAYTLTFPTPPAWVEVLDIRGEGWRFEP